MTTKDDEQFMQLAIERAEQARNQYPDREDPKVGAIIVDRMGKLIAAAYRGEPVGDEDPVKVAGDHGEFTLLKKCKGMDLRGATVYTTLEPCTTRKHPKRPCVEHLLDAGVGRVVIGMVDPNPLISGRGIGRLRERRVQVDLFSDPFAHQVETLNESFSTYQKGPSGVITVPPPSQVPIPVHGEAISIKGTLSRRPAKHEFVRCFTNKESTYWPQTEFHVLPDGPEGVTWTCNILLHETRDYDFLIAKVSAELELACHYYLYYGHATRDWKGFPFAELPTAMQVLDRRRFKRES